MDVRLPDGRLLKNVPEGTTKAQIVEKLGIGEIPKQTMQDGNDGYMSRLSGDFQKRKQAVQELKSQGKPFLAGSKAIGQGAGFVSDIIGEGVESGLRAIPDVIEQPIRSAGRKAVEVAMPVIKPIVKGYGELKSKYPNAMSVAEDVANVGMLLAPPTRTPVAPKKRILGEVGESLYKKGVEQSRNFVDELVLPKMTKAVETERQTAGLVSQSMLGSRKYGLNNIEKIASNEIRGIKAVKPLNSLSKNERIIRQEAINRSTSLVNDLEKLNIPIKREEVFDGVIAKSLDNITKNPMITSASGTSETANKLVTAFSDILNKSDQTAAGMMRARQQFDALAKRYKSEVFGDSSENAYKFTVREIRNNLNDLIDAKVPDAGVKDRLKKSHALFDAADNIADKVPDAGKNAIERLVQTIEGKVPGRSELVKLLTIGGIGAGAMASGAGGIAATAGGLYLGGKALGSATTKKAIGNLLAVTDMAIAQVKDKALLEQMRADKAALQDYLEYVSQQTTVEKE